MFCPLCFRNLPKKRLIKTPSQKESPLAKLKPIKSYQDALDALGDKDAIRLGHNTVLVRRATGQNCDGPAVIYHQTAVVVFNADGTFTLNSGGWETTTTAERIRKYSPAYVSCFQPKRGSTKQNALYLYINRQRLPFFDGLTVNAKGEPVKSESYKKFEILALDVWGNKKDGYEINDQHRTGVFFWTATGDEDEDVLKALRGALGHKKDARGYYDPIADENAYCFHRKTDGKPAYYAQHVDEE